MILSVMNLHYWNYCIIYGVQGVLLQWFKSYLQKRRQKVEPKYMWEPPTLFWMWTCEMWRAAEIGNGTSTLEVSMFADDTSSLCTAKDYNKLKIKLDIVLNHMLMWLQSNQFALNFGKTKMIILCQHQLQVIHCIHWL